MEKKNGFKIEKGVQLPGNGGALRRSWPFAEMSVDDSFLIGTDRTLVARCRSAASYYGAQHGNMKFSVCNTPEGYRCWRVA